MQTSKQITKKSSRISIKRNGRVLAIVIEGSLALLTISLVAIAYIAHLSH